MQIIVIGGGLAGLLSSILLNRRGFRVVLLEKKAYPFHRVCGEYISNEVAPFLQAVGLYPPEVSQIDQLWVTAPNGTVLEQPLGTGGFGVSRYAFDLFLSQVAKREGVTVRENSTVEQVVFLENKEAFEVQLKGGELLTAPVVIGAYGKRATLDKQLDRPFMHYRSPYMGVKYHVRYAFPDRRIALHNFQGGYCGISKVEGERYNVCYLAERAAFKPHGDLPTFERAVLHQNPHLRELFEQATFLLEKPEVINEISFRKKQCIEQHVLMVGDTAGLITPLCGNGMAMAMHGAVALSRLVGQYFSGGTLQRAALEHAYAQRWHALFARRLQAGRTLQQLFGNAHVTNAAVGTLRRLPVLTRWLIRQTHGHAFAALPDEIP